MLQDLLGFLAALDPLVVYGMLGVGAALENIVPPVPADTFVLLGGFLAGRERADAWTVFTVTWLANVTSALAVYAAGLRYGRSFFAEGAGRYVLHQGQLRRIRAFYDRWGLAAIFFTRFLPGLRAVVPAFAGVSHQRFFPVAAPLVLASAIWYGLLVWLGATAGRNIETIWRWVQGTNRVLVVVAVLLATGASVWWYRTRHPPASPLTPDGDPPAGRSPRDR